MEPCSARKYPRFSRFRMSYISNSCVSQSQCSSTRLDRYIRYTANSQRRLKRNEEASHLRSISLLSREDSPAKRTRDVEITGGAAARDRKTQSRVPRERASFGAVSFNKPRDLSEIVRPDAGETTGGVPAQYRRECKNTGERV